VLLRNASRKNRLLRPNNALARTERCQVYQKLGFETVLLVTISRYLPRRDCQGLVMSLRLVGGALAFVSAVQRILGSVGLANSARCIQAVEIDDEDEERRLLLNLKGNFLAPQDKRDGLAYRIECIGPYRQSLRVVWETDRVTKTADEVIAAKMKNKGEKLSARIWLKAYLREHGETLKAKILEAAEAAGHKRGAIEKAKAACPEILDFQLGWPAKAYWRLAE
jgi:hypothetical protein